MTLPCTLPSLFFVVRLLVKYLKKSLTFEYLLKCLRQKEARRTLGRQLYVDSVMKESVVEASLPNIPPIK